MGFIEHFERALVNSRRLDPIMLRAMRLLFSVISNAIVIVTIFELLLRTRHAGTFSAVRHIRYPMTKDPNQSDWDLGTKRGKQT